MSDRLNLEHDAALATAQLHAGEFGSILFAASEAELSNQEPAFFADLNLDQVVEAIVRGRDEYDLAPFFHTPLKDVEAVEYRHKIFRDLESNEIRTPVRLFGEQWAGVRSQRFSSSGKGEGRTDGGCEAVAGTRTATARGRGAPRSEGGLWAPNLRHVCGRSDGGPVGEVLALRLREPEGSTQRPARPSKGHASTLLYAMFRAAGAISDDELLTYRQFGSVFEGHPTPRIPWVDVATGSLGQGLPYAVGMALAGKRLDRLPFRVWTLCGDGEIAEGSQWEALEHAAFYELNNLVAIFDVNRLGQRGETMHGWDLESYADRARSFGCHAIVIDGHDVEAIDRAYSEALHAEGMPVVIVAKTIKGKGAKEVEDKNGYHGKALDDSEQVIAELGGIRNLRVGVARPDRGTSRHQFATSGSIELPTYERGEKVATRKAYGDALVALGKARGDVVGLDGEVSNSTYAQEFRDELPERYFEMYIAEQQIPTGRKSESATARPA